MKASERWLRERAELNARDNPTGSVSFWMDKLREQFPEEIARIDAAQQRFEACSRDACTKAAAFVGNAPVFDWELRPTRWEAIADVAEGIQKRSQEMK